MMDTPEPEHAPDANNDAANDAPPQSAVGNVLDQVKERGFITTGEIFAAFPDLEPDADELRELWEMFESRGIKVLDEIAEELQLEDQRRAGAPPAEPAPSVTEPRRAAEHREHRPGGAVRPGGGARPAEE